MQQIQLSCVDDNVRQLVDSVNSSIKCECIYLTGSRATGEGLSDKSDYDLMVVAKASSILSSRRRLTRLRSVLRETYPAKVELTLLTPQSVSRARDSLLLLTWNQQTRLVYGTRDILKDLQVGSFAPNKESVRDLNCFTIERLLRELRVDRTRGCVTIDKEGLQKMGRFLTVHARLTGWSDQRLTDLVSGIRSEAMKDNPDLRVVSRTCADYLEKMSDQFKDTSLLSQLSYLLTYHRISRLRMLDALSQRQSSKSQFISALTHLFRSTESDPPSILMLQRASQLLRSSLAFEKVQPSFSLGEDDPYTLWAEVKRGIRRSWDIVMDYHYPFGQVLLFRPFRTVLL